jgi:uncharacterized membrane protein
VGGLALHPTIAISKIKQVKLILLVLIQPTQKKIIGLAIYTNQTSPGFPEGDEYYNNMSGSKIQAEVPIIPLRSGSTRLTRATTSS